MNFRQSFVKCAGIAEVFPITNNVANIDINCHGRSIGEITETSFVWEHDLNCTIIFVNLRTINMEILKFNKYFK